MITNNFKKLLFGGIFGSTATAGNVPMLASVSVNIINGNTVYIGGSSYVSGNTGGQEVCSILNALNHPATSSGEGGVVTFKAGTGTTQATATDYKIETENSNLTIDAVSTAFTGNLTKAYTVTISNTSTDDINLTEIGLFLTTYYTAKTVMLDRTVLSTPITIPAGQSKSITYEIAF